MPSEPASIRLTERKHCETGTEALARIAAYMREQEDRTGNLLVVAHDGIIRLFVCHVLGIPVWRRFGMKIDPAGITELAWDPRAGAGT